MSLARLLGSDLPIIQAPMAGSQNHRLAAAVCKAGALGSLPAAMLSASALAEEISALRGLTEAAFNLNFFCHRSPSPDTAREQLWLQTLAPYYQKFQLTPPTIPSSPARLPFNEDSCQIVERFKPAVVSFHFGLPEADLLERVRQSGARIIASATCVAEGLWLQAQGVDAVIAQGLEAGGHRGHFLSDDLTLQLPTLALVPQLVRALNVPVIAAGGIFDRATVRAALNLGAAGVQVGTAFLTSPQASTSAVHRAALQSPAAQHTALTNLFSGRPARGIVNRLMCELGPLYEHAPAFPLASNALAALRSTSEAENSGDFSPLWAGQNAPLCQPMCAQALVAELAKGLL